jgi:hypothetical protein
MTDTDTETVETLLRETEPIKQDKFITCVDEMTELSEGDTLSALKTLMQDDQVSYSLDWKLQTELKEDTDE